MKVLHLSTIDTGGAANICFALHNALLDKGLSSNVITLKKTLANVNVEQYYDYTNPGKLRKIFEHYKSYLYPWLFGKLLRDQPKKHEVFTLPYSFFDLTKHPLYKECDIVHLNYISYLFDWKSFFRKNKKPIVWTMHDMNTFTGGCHHSEKCYEYRHNCNKCPQLIDTFIPNSAEKHLKMKMDLINPLKNTIFVSPSEWLLEMASNSKVLNGKDIRNIAHGVDLNIFFKRKNNINRSKFELPDNKRIILFLIDDFSRRNKGAYILKEALKCINEKSELFLLVIGHGSEIFNQDYIDMKKMSFVESSETLAEIYSVIDLTVLPSKYESFSLAAGESMACGTPVVAFNAAGQKERIDHKKNGYLAEPYSHESFARGIEYCLDISNNERLSINAENIIKMKYHLDSMIDKYISLYNELLLKK